MRVCLMILAFLASGVVFTSQPATAQEKKTVCLIAEIAQRFQLKKIGLMVFANEDSTVPIAAWKLEDKIYGEVKTLLAKNFHVKKIAAPYGVFQPLHEPGGLFRDTEAELLGMVRKVAAGSDCDYYLAITCGGSQFSSSNQYLTGLGVLETGTEAFGHNHQLYALSYLRVYDGKTFEVLKSERGQTEGGTLFKAIHGPSQEIDATAHSSLQAVADDPKTREIVWALLEKSITMTMPELFELETSKAAVKTKPKKSKEDWAPF